MGKNTPNYVERKHITASARREAAASHLKANPFQPSPCQPEDLLRALQLISNFHDRKKNDPKKIEQADFVMATKLVMLTLAVGKLNILLPLTAMPARFGLSPRQCAISKRRLLRCGLLRQTQWGPSGSVLNINLEEPTQENHMELVAKYKTKCRNCGGFILPGQPLLWAGKGTDTHKACPAPVTAATTAMVPVAPTPTARPIRCGDCDYITQVTGHLSRCKQHRIQHDNMVAAARLGIDPGSLYPAEVPTAINAV